MPHPTPTRSATAVNAVARETLRRIAPEQISPTPEATRASTREIAATHPDHPAAAPPPGARRRGQGRARRSSRACWRSSRRIHAGITVTRKREGLKRALVPRLEPLDALYARLNRLMDSWNGPNAETGRSASRPFLGTDIMGHGGTDDDAPGARLTASQPFVAPSNLFAANARPVPARRRRRAAGRRTAPDVQRAAWSAFASPACSRCC